MKLEVLPDIFGKQYQFNFYRFYNIVNCLWQLSNSRHNCFIYDYLDLIYDFNLMFNNNFWLLVYVLLNDENILLNYDFPAVSLKLINELFTDSVSMN